MTNLTARQFVPVKDDIEAAGIYVVIDYFSLALTHGLIALAAFRLLSRDDLDSEDKTRKTGSRFAARRAAPEDEER